MLASDKARYRGPARGAQGNALKTLLGIPFALGVDRAGDHRLGRGAPRAAGEHRRGRRCGRRPRHRPGRARGHVGDGAAARDHGRRRRRWAFGAALVNPHATITVDYLDYSDADSEPVFYKPSDQRGRSGHLAPASPHWYDRAAFAALVGAYIRDDRPRPAPMCRLASSSPSSTACPAPRSRRRSERRRPGITHLSQLSGRDDVIDALHDAMLTHAKPTPPGRLGAVGAEHYGRLLDTAYGVRRFWYKTAIERRRGAVGDRGRGRRHRRAGPNLVRRQSRSPRSATRWAARCLTADGEYYVGSARTRFSPRRGRLAAPRRRGPRVARQRSSSTRARSRWSSRPHRGAAAKALDEATKTLRREAEQRRKDARKAERAPQRARDEADKAERQNGWTLKDAVFEVLPEAKRRAGDTVAVRTLFYKVRPLIQQFTDDELDYAYFSQTPAARISAHRRRAARPVLRGARRAAPPARRRR